MDVLTIDLGGTHVKVLASGHTDPRKASSGPTMTPQAMVEAVKQLSSDWTYEAVSLGYPGPVRHNMLQQEPADLGQGWVGFDFDAAFGRPVRIWNDAAMQALGSYHGERMLFLGLGTGLGSALVVDGIVQPLELAHLPRRGHKTYEDIIGQRGLERLGKKKWRQHVNSVLDELTAALQPDYVVLGGGNARLLKDLPANARVGDTFNAFVGGFRMWSLAPIRRPDSEVHSNGAVATPAPATIAEQRILETEQAMLHAAAEEVVTRAETAVASGGRFTLALSGGHTSLGLYRLLASDESLRARMPWDRTHFFWGDERPVPPDDPDSNFGVARDAMLAVTQVLWANVHRIRGEAESASTAAKEYEQELRSFFHLKPGKLPRFDLVLLGMGTDGHTASLFPGTRGLTDNVRLVVANWVGRLYTERITLTVPVLNYAACVLFLVSGSDKAVVLKAVLEGPHAPEQLPAQLIRPSGGRLIWLLDRAAAQELEHLPRAATSARDQGSAPR